MNIQQEFSCNYPQLVYIEHRYLSNTELGVSYIAIHDSFVGGAIKVFSVKNGQVQWKNAIRTYQSWADINQKER